MIKMKNFIRNIGEKIKNFRSCEHKYIKNVYSFGKNSKPSYRMCKTCGKVMFREELKNRKPKRKSITTQ